MQGICIIAYKEDDEDEERAMEQEETRVTSQNRVAATESVVNIIKERRFFCGIKKFSRKRGKKLKTNRYMLSDPV